MAIGLGHKYWVELIKYKYGSLEECLQWIQENKPENDLYWFELIPQAEIKTNKRVKVKQYCANLVTDGNLKNRDKI